MKAIKLFANGSRFNATVFVQCCHRIEVKAYACVDNSGVVFDADALAAVPKAERPLFLCLLDEDMHDGLHTREAYANEVSNLINYG